MPAHKLPFQSALPASVQGLIGKAGGVISSGARGTAAGLQQANDAESPGSGVSPASRPLTEIPVKQINGYQNLLAVYGIQTELEGSNFMGVCPFDTCIEYRDKAPKFSMNIQTGMYQCFRCHSSGNSYTFIRAIHDHYLARTTEEDYTSLCSLRKGAIDVAICTEMQLAYNDATSEWMLPAWGREGVDKGIVNLYRWQLCTDPVSNKRYRQIQSGPTFKHVPYGVHRLREGNQRAIWVLEGHWDYLAFCTLLSTTKQTYKFDAIGAPGSGIIPKSYLSIFNGRSVVLAFDNDPAGEHHTTSLIQSMNSYGIMPTQLSIVTWPEGLASGFDISDVITSLPPKFIKKKVAVL